MLSFLIDHEAAPDRRPPGFLCCHDGRVADGAETTKGGGIVVDGKNAPLWRDDRGGNLPGMPNENLRNASLDAAGTTTRRAKTDLEKIEIVWEPVINNEESEESLLQAFEIIFDDQATHPDYSQLDGVSSTD